MIHDALWCWFLVAVMDPFLTWLMERVLRLLPNPSKRRLDHECDLFERWSLHWRAANAARYNAYVHARWPGQFSHA